MSSITQPLNERERSLGQEKSNALRGDEVGQSVKLVHWCYVTQDPDLGNRDCYINGNIEMVWFLETYFEWQAGQCPLYECLP